MSLIKRGLYIAITEKNTKPLNAHQPFYDIARKQSEIYSPEIWSQQIHINRQ